jgi:hypothetical protein
MFKATVLVNTGIMAVLDIHCTEYRRPKTNFGEQIAPERRQPAQSGYRQWLQLDGFAREIA